MRTLADVIQRLENIPRFQNATNPEDWKAVELLEALWANVTATIASHEETEEHSLILKRAPVAIDTLGQFIVRVTDTPNRYAFSTLLRVPKFSFTSSMAMSLVFVPSGATDGIEKLMDWSATVDSGPFAGKAIGCGMGSTDKSGVERAAKTIVDIIVDTAYEKANRP